MANLYDTSALKSFNEKDYINKMYDSYADSQKKLLEKNYTDSGAQLDTEKQGVQRQTDDYVKRTLVEAVKSQNTYTGPKLSSGASAQARLVRDNAQQSNVTTLQGKQNDANTEIERQRKLLADQYSAAIKKATADNDMARAQDLYEAAKAEEEQLLGYRKSISSLLAQKGDTSVQDSLLKGETPSPDYTGETWAQLLKNEGSINEIYDKQLESERLGLQMEHDKSMSDLDAEQQKNRAETDRRLTEAYVDALKKNRNYQEVQNAYGQGSGTAAQARLAREVDLQKTLTDLRSVQMGADADIGMQRYDLGQTYRDQLAKSQADISAKRIAALYDAAEKEEQALADTQQTIGQQLAEQNNYSVLGRLYGLTQDQIDRLQGTGAYAPVYSGGGDSTAKKSTGKPSESDSGTNIVMEAAQVAKQYGTEIAVEYVNSQNVSQATKNAAIQNAKGVAMTEYYKNVAAATAKQTASSSSTKSTSSSSKSTTGSGKSSGSSSSSKSSSSSRDNSAYWSTRR